jgi:hypothetical protein
LKVGIITDHRGRLTPAGTGAIRGTVPPPSGLPEFEFIEILYRTTDSGRETSLPVDCSRKSSAPPGRLQLLKHKQ